MNSKQLRKLYASAPDPPALQGLSAIDWAALEHAHGRARDVPALLRAAASDVAGHRNFALELLAETVWHQGTVYSATPHAVVFLYRMLEAEETRDKPQVAVLLATVAGCHLGAHPYDPRAVADENWAATRRAVAERFDLLYPYIRDRDWGVRHSVAWAVGRFPEVAVRLRANLETAYSKERDKFIRLALAWAIGQSPEAAPRIVAELEDAFRAEPDQYARQALRNVIDRLTQQHA